MDSEMQDIQTIIQKSFPLIEELLKVQGEFYPVATVMNFDGTVSSIGAFDGDDYPLSKNVITNLKKTLQANFEKKNYKAIAIFYDVKTTDPNTNEKTDAVAVFTEHVDGKTAYYFYYPYKLAENNEAKFSVSFGNLTDKEIFEI
jgi:hypothetical protein